MTIVYEGVGSLFDSDAQTLVCTVNCMGAMGAGIALEFKESCPGLYRAYKDHCNKGLMTVRSNFLYKPQYGPWVLCLPTKDHWKDPSKLEYIEYCLDNLSKEYEEQGIKSIALPPLGCGLGKLDYITHVKPLIYNYLDPIDIPVSILMASDCYSAKRQY